MRILKLFFLLIAMMWLFLIATSCNKNRYENPNELTNVEKRLIYEHICDSCNQEKVAEFVCNAMKIQKGVDVNVSVSNVHKIKKNSFNSEKDMTAEELYEVGKKLYCPRIKCVLYDYKDVWDDVIVPCSEAVSKEDKIICNCATKRIKK